MITLIYETFSMISERDKLKKKIMKEVLIDWIIFYTDVCLKALRLKKDYALII